MNLLPRLRPSQITCQKKSKTSALKYQTVLLMSPFSMRCDSCGEYIYKDQKVNTRKETTEKKYCSSPIYRFDIQYMRSARRKSRSRQIPKTDGLRVQARRKTQIRALARREAGGEDRGRPFGPTLDAKTEMAIAVALDEFRVRNARVERAAAAGSSVPAESSPVQ
ncbi:hypothetical protein BBP40_008879 [Aspergillus hancockii]|nr:hypothetical protein BBP40_008879 [Aspergillus hancockii]